MVCKILTVIYIGENQYVLLEEGCDARGVLVWSPKVRAFSNMHIISVLVIVMLSGVWRGPGVVRKVLHLGMK